MEMPTIKLTQGNRKQKGRRSAPMAEGRLTGKKEPYAYTFKEPEIGELKVLNSSSGWWVKEDGKIKLQKLVDAYKFFATDDQAIFYAGITRIQLKYFEELHPEFYTIKDLCRKRPGLLARKNLVGKLDKDEAVAKWWLERTEKETFCARTDHTTKGKELKPSVTSNTIVFADFDEEQEEPEQKNDTESKQTLPGTLPA